MKSLLALLLACAASFAMETNSTAPALPGTSWTVTKFGGQAPLAGHPISLEFDAEGKIGGNGSCNRFGGTCKIDGDKIEVGPLRSTRRACEPNVMRQEHAFLQLLTAAGTWVIDPQGNLFLRGEAGEISAEKRSASPED
ncbi:MAG: META domain-containing protein [Chthoniobacterales bacterium]|nr:META domain-containing protein [Chthoniobacterales bacterium]